MRFSVQTASLRQLVLLSFFLALIPVGVLLWQSNKSLSGVSNYAIASAEQAVSSVRQAESMQSLVVDIERAVRQFAVVRTDALQRLALNHIDNQLQLLEQLCRDLPDLALCGAQRSALQGLRARFNEPLTEVPEALLQQVRTQQQQITKEIWDLLEQQLDRQQQQVTSTQQQLAWETFALVMLTLLLVLWASGRIAAPVQKLDRMIRAIAQPKHQFPDEKLRGPRELTELGEQLRWLSSRLQQLEALRLILLRHASHELKTPLSSIREGCALLSEQLVGPLTPQQQEVVTLLNASADRLSVLTEQLLDYNRLLQQAQPNWSQVVPQQLMQECFNDHALSLQQRQQQVKLDCQLSSLCTDEMLFRRILDNLINNAQAYGAEGSPVWVKLYRQDESIVLEVANNGSPIPVALREKLFEPFQRGTTPRFDAVQGSGLGLSIVADCARLLGGHADIVDVVYADVCIRVRLPLSGEKPV
ncbi:two-component system sensor kinase [Alishewanella agri BL06]|jgi:two-component system sensor histidine kinase GlrK|uniref:histidine kinase n=1 Tax=Alishewanella agri BL06 TaxID=1195246 RepID=I9DSI2_9ALTE|nr:MULTISPECIES: HAMP domain-containing sensor histidine kinase [Alishewanella]EIW89040.1 two-component system sensor kinase [Alishewanella agri BL06]KRS21269.1 histidine kinase [Alishewanella sp. WH16-1]OZB39264.1 MAG: two-component sensor histidine kinase [Alishewanella sp. 34-51-39]